MTTYPLFLRKPVAGDTAITTRGFMSAGEGCYHNGTAVIPNTLQLRIDNVTYPLVHSDFTFIGYGFGNIKLPNNVILKDNQEVQVVCICDNANSSQVETALPVKFAFNQDSYKACSGVVNVSASYEDIIRIYTPNVIATTTFGKLLINGQALNASDLFAQTQDTLTNLTFAPNGDITKSISINDDIVFSNLTYHQPSTLEFTRASLDYFTFRLGYIEVIAEGGNIKIINYLVNGDENSFTTTSVVGDKIKIVSNVSSYIVKFNEVDILTFTKSAVYSVNGFTNSFNPATSPLGIPTSWAIPSIGSYEVGVQFANIKLAKSIIITPCATAVNDVVNLQSFEGDYSSSVKNNDLACSIGATTYKLIPDSEINCFVEVYLNGNYDVSFAVANTASFRYGIYCDDNFIEEATVSFNKTCIELVDGIITGNSLLSPANISAPKVYKLIGLNGTAPSDYGWSCLNGSIVAGQHTDTVSILFDTAEPTIINCAVTNCASLTPHNVQLITTQVINSNYTNKNLTAFTNFLLENDVRTFQGYTPCNVGITSFELADNSTIGTLVFNGNGTFNYSAAGNPYTQKQQGYFTYNILCDGTVVDTKQVTIEKCLWANGEITLVGQNAIWDIVPNESKTFKISNVTGDAPFIYEWTTNNGVITSGQGTDTVTISFPTATATTVVCTIGNCNDTCSTVISKPLATGYRAFAPNKTYLTIPGQNTTGNVKQFPGYVECNLGVTTIGLTTTLEHGFAAFAEDGTFMYAPNEGESQPEAIQYSIYCDGIQVSNGIITITYGYSGNVEDKTYLPVQPNTVITDNVKNYNLFQGCNAGAQEFLITKFPLHGIAIIDDNGDFIYTPFQNYVGKDSFEYSQYCNIGRVDTAKINVEFSFGAAGSVNDYFTTLNNAPLTNSVATNDVPCTIGNTYYELINSSIEGGLVVLNQNGGFTFTPAENVATGKFKYWLKCGATFETANKISQSTVIVTNNLNSGCTPVTNFDIVGNPIVYISTAEVYEVKNIVGGVVQSYNWNITNGTIINGQGTNLVTVRFNNTGLGSLSVDIVTCSITIGKTKTVFISLPSCPTNC